VLNNESRPWLFAEDGLVLICFVIVSRIISGGLAHVGITWE